MGNARFRPASLVFLADSTVWWVDQPRVSSALRRRFERLRHYAATTWFRALAAFGLGSSPLAAADDTALIPSKWNSLEVRTSPQRIPPDPRSDGGGPSSPPENRLCSV